MQYSISFLLFSRKFLMYKWAPRLISFVPVLRTSVWGVPKVNNCFNQCHNKPLLPIICWIGQLQLLCLILLISPQNIVHSRNLFDFLVPVRIVFLADCFSLLGSWLLQFSAPLIHAVLFLNFSKLLKLATKKFHCQPTCLSIWNARNARSWKPVDKDLRVL